MICAWMETSRADTGSSAMMSLGSTASARAMAMRWRWPPENSCGYFRTKRGDEAHLLHQVRTRARRISFRGHRLVRAYGLGQGVEDRHARVERGVGILEDHLEIRARLAEFAAAQGGEVPTGQDDRAFGGRDQLQDGAAESGLAAAGFARPGRGSSPFCSVSDTPSTAFTSPRRWRNRMPCSTGKWVFRFWIWRNGVMKKSLVRHTRIGSKTGCRPATGWSWSAAALCRSVRQASPKSARGLAHSRTLRAVARSRCRAKACWDLASQIQSWISFCWTRTQAEWWLGATSGRGSTGCRHLSAANSQRGAKAQPGDGSGQIRRHARDGVKRRALGLQGGNGFLQRAGVRVARLWRIVRRSARFPRCGRRTSPAPGRRNRKRRRGRARSESPPCPASPARA